MALKRLRRRSYDSHASRTAFTMQLEPGQAYPLGATWDGRGTNFALFSGHGERVELCLFDSLEQPAESHRLALPEQTDGVWHGYLPGAGPGQLYGYRVSGPYQPEQGHRFNSHKLLLDPFTRAIGRSLRWHDSLYGHRLDHPEADLSFDPQDSAPHAPLGTVTDDAFDWGDDRPPRTDWRDTVIYEVHAKGFTMLHPEVPADQRGTYLGLCSEPALTHLKKLGVTAVELLPVHQHIDEHRLVRLGLTNYWGYNTLAFFAPEIRYARDATPAAAVREFKTMVRTLHAAGLEVILDVVYNHSAESHERGPTLSLRGIDNAVYYRLAPDNPRRCLDLTGTGNTLNTRHPRVLQLIVDSLRYWAQEMHVDGFRFDLAAALGREDERFHHQSAFFAILRQDPVLSRVKLIAEPWDLGPGGYQLGNFPGGWSSWNGRYRDEVRTVWNRGGSSAMLATRLAGSSDLFDRGKRPPQAGVNFITSHDGFALQDLVSYNQKHNEANGESNRDGDDNNHSWNYGVEGPTDDAAIQSLRERQKRNLLATLLLSQGVPMILGGDEIGRTQQGNNNAYCHDSELSWLHWDLSPDQRDLMAFTAYLLRLRRERPELRQRRFFRGQQVPGLSWKDITWVGPGGSELTAAEWKSSALHCLGALIVCTEDRQQEVSQWTALCLLFNTGESDADFTLPRCDQHGRWVRLLDTAQPDWDSTAVWHERDYPLRGRSVAAFQWERRTEEGERDKTETSAPHPLPSSGVNLGGKHLE